MRIIDPSSTQFDNDLKKIEQFKRIPAMLPFVGKNYFHPSHSKLLLIGESGYFPHDSTSHKSAKNWYLTKQAQLSAEEIQYLNWRSLFGGEWNANGHEMYREINRFLREILKTEENRAVSHAAYTNAFFRPASEHGQSIKHCLTDFDIEVSLETLTGIIDCLEPDAVVFLSKFSWDKIGWQIAEQKPSIDIEFTAHAADRRWFNRKGYAHAKPKLMSFLRSKYIF